MSIVAKLTPEYIAGFVDGEGWTGITKSLDKMRQHMPRYTPGVVITNTYLPLLETLKDRYRRLGDAGGVLHAP